ncbi:hypothetical protein ABZ671_01540 [Micromonospora sp. NPDC006766]|uniref:hypothetical protein n=1 Tax=Micromonospora sp. NPDC006766 TaxID=3154778 RepID=UPI0033F52AB9
MLRRLAALLALPLLALPAGCATPVASAAAPQPQPPVTRPPQPATPEPAQSYWPWQQRLTEAAEAVNNAAARRWPDTFAGTSVDVPANVLMVHRVAPAAGLDAAVRKMVPDVTIKSIDARYSAKALDGWIAQVRADTAWWQRHGVTIHSTYVRIGLCVVAEVADPQRDATRIKAHYPAESVCVEQGYPAEPLIARR